MSQPMTWTVWQNKPKPPHQETEKSFFLNRVADKVEEFEVQLVHWTDEDSDSGKECRVVNIAVNEYGMVTVEHSTTEYNENESLVTVEFVTRTTIPGWEE